MTAEGEASETTAFLADLKDTMAVFIQQTESSESPATGEFRGFEIRM